MISGNWLAVVCVALAVGLWSIGPVQGQERIDWGEDSSD